ncbi:MAG: toprim domain-containing protein [Thermoleophilia bacterium]
MHDRSRSLLALYTDEVLPALAGQLDRAFPEFGWRRDRDGWVATNDELTHRLLGVRADRVVAHGEAPAGFLVHGAGPTLWTAYVNGGEPPRGAAFVDAVRTLAERAGLAPNLLEEPRPVDRRADLLHDFFVLGRRELMSDRGAAARAYLVEQRGFPEHALDESSLGLVPAAERAGEALRRLGYSREEIDGAAVLADSRWPGRIVGAWRDDRARVRTLWARTLDPAANGDGKYLYLRGASRAGLLPYGASSAIAGPGADRSTLVLVEGVMDVHQLRARGFENAAALGGTSIRPATFELLARRGVERVILALDNDQAGREATARVVEAAGRAADAPAILVLDPAQLGRHKDPDALVRSEGIAAFRSLLGEATCGITWRALEHVLELGDGPSARREALARAGRWLGRLPARLSLEQEDAVHAIAETCGYSPEAVGRAFRARFWRASDRDQARDLGPIER